LDKGRKIGYHLSGTLPPHPSFLMVRQVKGCYTARAMGGGVRQGEPPSPMLFLIAIEPLYKLFKKADQFGLLSNLSRSYDNLKMSLYADNAAIFI
jgi:hypothetical protein